MSQNLPKHFSNIPQQEDNLSTLGVLGEYKRLDQVSQHEGSPWGAPNGTNAIKK